MNPKFYLVIPVMTMFGLAMWMDWDPQVNTNPVDVQTSNKDKISTAQLVLAPTTIEKTVAKLNTDIPESIMERLPRSLRGIPLPEPLAIDDDGQLRINDQIKKLFDFYLSAIGEESLELIVGRIKARLQEQLPAVAAAQAQEILASYLMYRNQLADILSDQANSATDGSYSFEQIALLREQISIARGALFDPEVLETFFAQQDQYDNYMTARQLMIANAELTPDERDLAKQLLEANTPQWLVEQQQRANQLNLYREKATQLAQQGDVGAIRDMAQRQFGVAAADRLVQLQQRRQQWQRTVAQYHQKLEVLLDSSGLDADDRQMQIRHLREQYFSQQELRRVAAIDHARFGLQ